MLHDFKWKSSIKNDLNEVDELAPKIRFGVKIFEIVIVKIFLLLILIWTQNLKFDLEISESFVKTQNFYVWT